MTSFRQLNRYSPSVWVKTLLDAQEKSNIFTLSLHMHHCRFSRGLAQRPVKTKEFRIGGTEWYERKQMMFTSGSLLWMCVCVCVYSNKGIYSMHVAIDGTLIHECRASHVPTRRRSAYSKDERTNEWTDGGIKKHGYGRTAINFSTVH